MMGITSKEQEERTEKTQTKTSQGDIERQKKPNQFSPASILSTATE
jgi:hypothetical protein